MFQTSQQSALTPKQNETRTLWCIVHDDFTPFKASYQSNTDIHDLKELVHEKGINDNERILAKDLVLWKLKNPIAIKPSRTLTERIRSLGYKFADFADELDELVDKVSGVFPHPPEDHLHIIVQPPAAANVCPREATISALYERLNKYSFVQVRGTPASGKTMLAKLLASYVAQQEPDVHVIWISMWPLMQAKEFGGACSYLQKQKGWIQGRKTVFIIDEAQESYDDRELWIDIFKSMHEYDDRRAIIFASYGSPGSRIMVQGTPIQLTDFQRVTLRPIHYNDGLQPVGLFLSRIEFDDLISKRYPNGQYYFHSSFFDAVFELTGGHVGAILDFVQIVVARDSYRGLKHSTSYLSYTWDSFLKTVGPRDLSTRLTTSASIFARGLPENKDLQRPAIARIFSAVLRAGVVIKSNFIAEDDLDALQRCFFSGWLHTDKLSDIGQPDEVGHFFTSSLHRWYVEWKLLDAGPVILLQAVNILEFVLDVISKFSPRILSAERRIGPGCIQRRPEAQYQDEFYRSCHICSKGSLVTFPEFGTAKGRVDFYIPAKKWGVELGANLDLSDYIILDCRNKSVMLAHPNIPKLYHVVFSEDFRQVLVLDNKLKPVDNGEIRLLASSS